MRGKLLRVVTADVYLSDAALWQSYRDDHETVTMQLTAVVPRDVVPDSAVPLTEAEVKKYYDASPRAVPAAQDRLPELRPDLPPARSPSDSAAALARAERSRKEIHDGAPFAEVAKRESSDTVSGAKGGDLGEFKKGQMDPAFEKAAFSLPIGTLSEPVLSQLRLPPHPDRIAVGRQGQGPPHPDSDRGHWGPPRSPRCPGRQPGIARRRAARSRGPGHRRPGHGAQDRPANPTQDGGKVMIGYAGHSRSRGLGLQGQAGGDQPGDRVELRLHALPRWTACSRAGIRPSTRSTVRWKSPPATRRSRRCAKAVVSDLSKRLAEGSRSSRPPRRFSLPYQQFAPVHPGQPAVPERDPGRRGVRARHRQGGRRRSKRKEGTYFLKVLKRAKADSAGFAAELDQFGSSRCRPGPAGPGPELSRRPAGERQGGWIAGRGSSRPMPRPRRRRQHRQPDRQEL